MDDYKLIKLNLGRNALRYIIRTYNITEIHIPYYLCDVVRQNIIREHCKPVFYHIDDNFYPEKEFKSDAFILYPNYFGICDKNMKELSKTYTNLIADNAHSFYSKPLGTACFNSLRKFLPVYNGSFLWTKKLLTDDFIEDEYKAVPTNETEKLKNEIDFSHCDIKLLNHIISERVITMNNNEMRKNIFKILHSKFGQHNELNIDLGSSFSPFVYPFLASGIEEADELVQLLRKDNKIIYRYWNKIPETFSEYKFYSRLVCIPLDNCL